MRTSQGNKKKKVCLGSVSVHCHWAGTGIVINTLGLLLVWKFLQSQEVCTGSCWPVLPSRDFTRFDVTVFSLASTNAASSCPSTAKPPTLTQGSPTSLLSTLVVDTNHNSCYSVCATWEKKPSLLQKIQPQPKKLLLLDSVWKNELFHRMVQSTTVLKGDPAANVCWVPCCISTELT